MSSDKVSDAVEPWYWNWLTTSRFSPLMVIVGGIGVAWPMTSVFFRLMVERNRLQALRKLSTNLCSLPLSVRYNGSVIWEGQVSDCAFYGLLWSSSKVETCYTSPEVWPSQYTCAQIYHAGDVRQPCLVSSA